MTERVTLDGNQAVADVAYRLSEVIAIYPITPSSSMGELSDEWAAHKRKNLWGGVPEVTEMQSEGGAAGAVHGALQGGALATTFTASQGLLLMIPNMYKIAGELTPFAMHVSARTLATHALSIFGDHSDVMACRQTGFAMLASASVQEAHDMALIAHAVTLESRVPFLHFFDGFRTSHEVAKIERLGEAELSAMVDDGLIAAHRARALSPEHPVLRGSAHNPDTYFQAREASNPYYLACPGLVTSALERFAELTGRRYRLFDYHGHPEAERVIVMMGSGAETADETCDWLTARGEKVGVVRVRLYRPFSVPAFIAALPRTVRSIAVLDRTKEPGAVGEPLFTDVVAAFEEAMALDLWTGPRPLLIGGRYGLSSKEFTPAMVRAIFDNLAGKSPKRRFTIGIVDDVTHTSLPFDDRFDLEADDVVRAVFYGLGADGTVGANKSAIKIIGEETDNFAQGYFVYDSKKSGAMTISHLRFGPRPIHSAYLVSRASFVAVHQFGFLERYEVLDRAEKGATLLVSSPHPAEHLFDALPREVQEQIVEKGLRVFTIDAERVARDAGMGGRINTIMMTCFFALSGVLPKERAIADIKASIAKTYRSKGEEVVRKNHAVVDAALAHLEQVVVPPAPTTSRLRPRVVSEDAPDFVQRVTAVMLAGQGDRLPVSAFPADGTWPTGTSRWEKRDLAKEIPAWDPELCIQCNKCALVCPHAAIRAKVYAPERIEEAPPGFLSTPYKGRELAGERYTLQVAPEDCTGCELCVALCPTKDKAIKMVEKAPIAEREKASYAFFLGLPEADRTKVAHDAKGSQLLEPLFEYSGACAGCGETPYIKLITQLFGDRVMIANATGCSSIFGGNLPTTPYTTNAEGRGPAWANSLFEDNAEFGLGMRLAADAREKQARQLVEVLRPRIGDELARGLLAADQSDEPGIIAQRERVARLRAALVEIEIPEARRLEVVAEDLVKKSVWIVGGDGWAYDIGYGGLDHVLASGKKVNILVLDTEVYSNTGGQQSKATPKGAAARFASSGKSAAKKDLGMLAMAYRNVYVAQISLGGKDAQAVKALLEAEAYPGPSLVIAYAHCIAHGYDLAEGAAHQKAAVETGYWPLYRFDPRRADTGEIPLVLDSRAPKGNVADYMKGETRFRIVDQEDHARFEQLSKSAQEDILARWAIYEKLASITKRNGA